MIRWSWLSLLLLALVATRGSAQSCPGDLNDDGQVTVDEILVVVNASLFGCDGPPSPTAVSSPTATPTPSVPLTPSRTPTRTRSATPTRTATAVARFVDNGDGTITDRNTGLMWEKKSDDGSAHDKDFQFSWSVSGNNQPTGTLFSAFLPTINSQRFAGHNDWRLPTLEELETIVDRNAPSGDPTVPAVFFDDCTPGCDVEDCSCTTALNHWTATTNPANVQQAAYVLFNTGQSGFAFKTLLFYARAVRGG